MSDRIQKISVVFPVYDEENNLKILYEKVKKACAQSNIDYEMVFVDNGSTDNSLNIMKELRERDGKVIYISLSRNFGQQNAIFAGMSYCTGDAVITMDADLQHPPLLIPQMIDLWRGGAEVVYTIKNQADLTFIKHFIVKVFYWLISKISGLKLEFGQSDFRLLDRKVLKEILKIPEYHKFLRGQVRWVGFKQKCLTYNVEKRRSGKSKFSYGNLFSFALDGIFGFSRYPLHLLMLFGIIISGLSVIYMIFTLVIWILKISNLFPFWYIPPGWFTLAISIFFLGSIQLIAIGILGEYIGRTYDQTKGRPVFIVREASIQRGDAND